MGIGAGNSAYLSLELDVHSTLELSVLESSHLDVLD